MTKGAMTEHEHQILRECAGELPPSPWGAWVGACLESLRGFGYVDLQGRITEKGRQALAKGHQGVRR